MRANFSAIVAIEKALGKSMIALINQIAAGDVGVTESAHIIYHGLRGNTDARLSFEQVGEAVIERGLSAVSLPIIEFVSRSLNGVSVGKPSEPSPAR
jgi:hypothetical protein